MQESGRNGTTQQIDYDGDTAVTNPFGAQTRQVRLASNSACHYKIGDGVQVSATSSTILPANWVEFVTVTPGQRISAIKAATNSSIITATAGSLWVTEMTN